MVNTFPQSKGELRKEMEESRAQWQVKEAQLRQEVATLSGRQHEVEKQVRVCVNMCVCVYLRACVGRLWALASQDGSGVTLEEFLSGGKYSLRFAERSSKTFSERAPRRNRSLTLNARSC